MRRLLAGALFILSLYVGVARAKIWFVRPDGVGRVATIQEAIDFCSPGDTVVAMSGVYTGPGNHDIDFRGKAIVVMAESSYDPMKMDSSIVDCGYLNRAFIFQSGEDGASVLDGFVIQKCSAWDDSLSIWGAGILMLNSSPTISNNVIRFCRAMRGGGIAAVYSSPRIHGNSIQWCQTPGSGAGIYCYRGTPRIEKNKINFNDCTYCEGTGVSCIGCTSLRIADNDISWNWGASNYAATDSEGFDLKASGALAAPAYIMSGGVLIAQSDGIIENNAIYRNHGEIVAYGSTLSIRDNEISGGFTAAAVHCIASEVVIEGNTISSLGCQRGGSIILEQSGISVIADNIIGPGDSDFGHGDGSGIRYDGDSTSVIENNIIHDHRGAGIRCLSSIRISNNVIYCNGGDFYGGGGIYSEASPVIEGNTIVGNVCSWAGAGIYCAQGSSPVIRSNIIAHNERGYGERGGDGIYSDSPHVTVECCNVFGNEGSNYVGIPDQTGLNGNISVRPIFCDPNRHDYSIDEHSPCIPGNHPSGSYCGLIGARGIGCHLIDADVVSTPAQPLTLHQNHPNPFNPSTTIAFYLPEKGRIRLEIYDISGRRIATLADGARERGSHAIVWNGTDDNGNAVSSGIYISRLAAGAESLSRKMVLLR